MKMNEHERIAFMDAAKPLIKWLNDNCHPHCVAIVDCNTVEVFEGIAVGQTDEFIRD